MKAIIWDIDPSELPVRMCLILPIMLNKEIYIKLIKQRN